MAATVSGGTGRLSSRLLSSNEESTDGSVGEFLGLRTLGAAAMVGFFILAFAVAGFMTAPSGGLWAEVLAWLAVSTAAVFLIRGTGDPLSIRITLAVALAGPVAMAFVTSVMPADFGPKLALWPQAAATALATYLCVRGRTRVAWVSLLTTLVICVWWAHRVGVGLGQGLLLTANSLAPLVMSTFFALVIRPAARNVYAMREAGTAAAAAEAAQRAAAEERDRQLEKLDEQARPLLERLADATPLDDADRRTCALVEARLRDSLRAPLLDVPDVREAAWSARARDVEVVLLDDHGMDRAEPAVRRRITGAVADVLATAADGSVTVRILPPGRSVLATVLQSAEDRIVRAEYDRDGYPVVAAPLGGDR